MLASSKLGVCVWFLISSASATLRCHTPPGIRTTLGGRLNHVGPEPSSLQPFAESPAVGGWLSAGVSSSPEICFVSKAITDLRMPRHPIQQLSMSQLSRPSKKRKHSAAASSWRSDRRENVSGKPHRSNSQSFPASVRQMSGKTSKKRVFTRSAQSQSMYHSVGTGGGRITRSPPKHIEEWQQAVDLLNSAQERDQLDYHAVIGLCAQAHQWQQCLDLMEQMDLESQTPLLTTFNIILGALALAGEWQTAVNLLEYMLGRQVVPDILSYNKVIWACANQGEWKVVLRLMQTVKEEGLTMDADTYEAAIHCASVGGRSENVVLLFNWMAADPNIPSIEIYRTLIGCLYNSADEPLVDQIYGSGHDRGMYSHWSAGLRGAMDMHQFSVPMAKAAVRMVLNDMQRSHRAGLRSAPKRSRKEQRSHVHDPRRPLIIITGAGRGSEGGRSVIKPALRSYLWDHCHPRVRACELPGNPGVIIVRPKELQRWLDRDGTVGRQ